jgi:uncharacterized membrane protein required for colicin V production
MVLDIAVAVFLILTMTSGYIAGGFRELAKIVVFITVFTLFKLPPVEALMKDIAGASYYTSFYVLSFLGTYFIFYYALFFSIKGILIAKEGALGEANRTIGIFAGFIRGILILIIMVYILEALLVRGFFVGILPHSKNSMFYSLVKYVLEMISLKL